MIVTVILSDFNVKKERQNLRKRFD